MDATEIILETEEKMLKSVEATKNEMTKIRTGRASATMLDGIKVEYYGNATPINQMANVAIPEPRLITITAWDKSQISAIEKSILASDLGMTPSNDGSVIRLKVPELTQERRNEMVKLVKKYGEEGKVAIRNVRRDANESIKKLEKDSQISKDESQIHQDEIQQMTDKFCNKIDDIVKNKEKELLEV